MTTSIVIGNMIFQILFAPEDGRERRGQHSNNLENIFGKSRIS